MIKTTVEIINEQKREGYTYIGKLKQTFVLFTGPNKGISLTGDFTESDDWLEGNFVRFKGDFKLTFKNG